MLKKVQGLFVPFACVGSGDPVRVLCLYTTNTLDTLLLYPDSGISMYEESVLGDMIWSYNKAEL